MCSLVLATVGFMLTAPPLARGQIRPDPSALAGASPELVERLRADPFAYFRFVNRPWTARVCEAFGDLQDLLLVRLHGDAHVEQFALTKDAWGLDDFDDSVRGPDFVDIVRFLGSIDLATRQRGWTRDRDALWDRFFEGYRRGLSDPGYRPPEPDLVRVLRAQAPVTRAAYLAWAERLMQPMDEARLKSVVAAVQGLDLLVRRDRPSLAPGYFGVVRAGWVHLGIGSAGIRKVLIRVQGPTTDPDDDVLLEGKEVTNLEGVRCLEGRTTPPAIRVIDGALQLGRLKHDILAVGPTMLIPAAADRAEHWLDWWVCSWEPSYREVHVSDLRSVKDLADIAFDSGVQLGAGKLVSVRKQLLASDKRLESRLRKETSALVEELLAGWRELGGR
ncbi:MAG TPA: DUF2252 family protein [Vicinamibacterales bacterium]